MFCPSVSPRPQNNNSFRVAAYVSYSFGEGQELVLCRLRSADGLHKCRFLGLRACAVSLQSGSHPRPTRPPQKTFHNSLLFLARLQRASVPGPRLSLLRQRHRTVSNPCFLFSQGGWSLCSRQGKLHIHRFPGPLCLVSCLVSLLALTGTGAAFWKADGVVPRTANRVALRTVTSKPAPSLGREDMPFRARAGFA